MNLIKKRRDGDGNKDPHACWKCGKCGHQKANCPKAENNNKVAEDDEIALVSNDLGGNEKKLNFLYVGDSGATCHMGPTLAGCENIVYMNEQTTIGDGRQLTIKVQATFVGYIIEKSTCLKKKIRLSNYAYVPNLDEFLFSLTYAKKQGMAIKDEGKTISLVKGNWRIFFDHIVPRGSSFQMCMKIVPENIEKLAAAVEKSSKKVHFVDEIEKIEKVSKSESSKNSKKIVEIDEELFHDSIGHPSRELTLRTAKTRGIKLRRRKTKCLACALGKAKKKPAKKFSEKRSKILGERLYVDISSIKGKSRGGRKFWLLIADDATPKKWSFFLKSKDEQYRVLVNFVKNCVQIK